MTDEDSPIVHYYPINFETDLNGKRNDWEAVVLIPFIDEVSYKFKKKNKVNCPFQTIIFNIKRGNSIQRLNNALNCAVT